MSRFFDNVTGKQKLILIFGSFVLLIAAAVLFPEAYGAVFASVGDLFSRTVALIRGE